MVSLDDLISYCDSKPIFYLLNEKKNNNKGTPTVAYTSVLMVHIFLRFFKFLESFIIVHISHYSLHVIIIYAFFISNLFKKLKTKLNLKKTTFPNLIKIVN